MFCTRDEGCCPEQVGASANASLVSLQPSALTAPRIRTLYVQVLKHEPSASIGLQLNKTAGGELCIELPLDTNEAMAGDAFAVLHAMWYACLIVAGTIASSAITYHIHKFHRQVCTKDLPLRGHKLLQRAMCTFRSAHEAPQ